jgi:hypothetical protein
MNVDKDLSSELSSLDD